MTEKMNTRLGDLKARQQKGEHMHCPRCGADVTKTHGGTSEMSTVNLEKWGIINPTKVYHNLSVASLTELY